MLFSLIFLVSLDQHVFLQFYYKPIITPPARRVWRSFKFVPCLFFSRVESRATPHGLYRCAVYRLLSEPMYTRLLNSISSGMCRQNTQFNMYSTTSKQQGCTFKNFHPKCFIATNFDKFHREAVARAVNRGDVFDSIVMQTIVLI